MSFQKLAAGTFFGRQSLHHLAGGFRLSEWEYRQGATAPRHYHENAYFNLVLQGGHVETLAAGDVECSPAVLVYHPPGEVHAGEISCANTRIFDIELAPSHLERLHALSAQPAGRVVFQGGHPVWLVQRIYQEAVQSDSLSELSIEALGAELIVALGRSALQASTSAPPRWLSQVRDLLHDRFSERLTLEEIARVVDIHPDHLVHMFRRHYRCTIGEYVRRLRIEYSCQQITQGELSLAQIARAAGFSDQSHFTRTFKRIKGITPSAFQQHI